ncbi:glycosyltransferase [Kineothrix sp. MSJ-39]|uniref:glycosyltransferase family protein n=1 Tax=Kineothrix sp. MSJ-39 TaxID=2841533 RepID=UPI001C11419C|nr:DUF3880 domain-containing protein [Kineothrix sp. MSJ-39]MBU5431051.1 glycosyltransferase [Kineothrix sp. MSJ-39]
MKLLLYKWNSYLQYDIRQICKEKKIEIESFSWEFSDKNTDEHFVKWFREKIDLKCFDAVISINYFPLLSKVCKEQNRPYIAWCYDNPLNILDIEETLGNQNNYVFFFDQIQAQIYMNKGFDTVYYAPLGVNRTRLKRLVLTREDAEKYQCDVSLVGSLYESKINEILAVVGAYEKGYLKALMNVQQNLYGYYMLDELLTDAFMQKLNEGIHRDNPQTEFTLRKEALTFAMASEITRRERLILLTVLGKRYNTRLYSFQNSELIQGVKMYPPVDYVSQMPLVFRASKINLNPILRCIQSGIPLRALDVMGAGGFLLSSYQPELVEYFAPDKEMVVYESIEDAVEKAAFYLNHEANRDRICCAAREKVLKLFSLQDRFDQILQLVFENSKTNCVVMK